MNSRRDSQFHEGAEVMQCVCVRVRVRVRVVCGVRGCVRICVLVWRCIVSRSHQMT